MWMHAWTRVEVCEQEWMRVQTHVDMSGGVWRRVDVCGCMRTWADTCVDMSGGVWTRVEVCVDTSGRM